MLTSDPAAALDRLVAARSPESCVLLVHPDPEIAVRTLEALVDDRGWRRIAVGRDLGSELVSVAPQRRPRHANMVLREMAGAAAPDAIALIHIDILFEPSLALDPLSLLRQLARVTPIAAAWPGSVDSTGLTFASPAHGHYRVWTDPDVGVVALPR